MTKALSILAGIFMVIGIFAMAVLMPQLTRHEGAIDHQRVTNILLMIICDFTFATSCLSMAIYLKKS